MLSISIQPTPNPNSLKFTAGKRLFIPSGMEAFASPAQAAGHPLGEPLFAIPGVANVFILPQFVTITRHPRADWDDMIPRIEAVLEAHLAG